MKKTILALVLMVASKSMLGQTTVNDSIRITNTPTFNYKALIIPSLLIGYGFVGLENDGLKALNVSTSNELKEHIDERISIDDFSQYSAFVSVYGLNALGIKGKHNFKDRTIILATAYLIMSSSVLSLKSAINEERPDGSNNNSFPSGHTATAFMGAEFLYQEYKDVSVWYGVTGYLVATGTGFFRMYNQRHWLTDIATGAGIGILSTKIAYWLHPVIKRAFFKDKETNSGMVMPFYDGKDFGVGLVMSF